MLPYYEAAIVPQLKAGETVLVSAHGNSLRALVKHLSGISDAEISRVFERFRTLPNDSRAGSGLGLATVSSLVSKLGGSVSLQNRAPGPGLVARVHLPYAS